MKQGRILFHPKFEIKKHKYKGKYCIILNTPKSGGPYLFCMVSSQNWYNQNRDGCHTSPCTYKIKLGLEPKVFPEQTWILINKIRVLKQREALRWFQKHKVEKRKLLEKNNLKNLLGCIDICQTIRLEYKKLIFNNSHFPDIITFSQQSP